jgi:hypothetical protein
MNLLFTSGTARGGTNFRTLLLNNHQKIQLSIDPFIPLYRLFRDCILERNGFLFDSQSGTLDDYYFSQEKIKVKQVIQSANPDIPFDISKWNSLKVNLQNRMKLASENLIPYLEELPATTFKQVFENTSKLILNASKKNRNEIKWIGYNDNWTVEFFPLLAQLFPEAKFILHLRDPRAVIYSSEYAEPDPAKHPTVISFSRHLRKYSAFAIYLKNLSILKDRLLITYYEPFIANPEIELKKVCKFLDLEYSDSLLDVNSFKKANGENWESDWNTYQKTEGIWKSDMPEEMVELTEFVCGPEMGLHDYTPMIFDKNRGMSSKTIEFAIKNIKDCKGWNTDFLEIERTIGSEFFRLEMLKSSILFSTEEIERNFLFNEVFLNLTKSN